MMSLSLSLHSADVRVQCKIKEDAENFSATILRLWLLLDDAKRFPHEHVQPEILKITFENMTFENTTITNFHTAILEENQKKKNFKLTSEGKKKSS